MNKSLSRNTLFTASTSGITLVFGVLQFSILSRQLTLEEFGSVGLALTVSALLGLLPNYGLEMFVIKQLVQGKDILRKAYASILCIKVIFSIISLLAMYWYVHQSSLDLDVFSFMLFACAATCLSFVTFFNSVNKASQDFHVETYVTFIQNFIQLAGLFALSLILNLGVRDVAWIWLISRLAGLGLSVFAFQRSPYGFSVSDPFFQSLSFEQVKDVLRSAFPFAVAAIFGALYFSVDTLIVAALSSIAEVGLYQASIRLITPLMVIPTLFMTAFFPRIVAEASSEPAFLPGKTTGTSNLLVHILLFVGVAMMLILIVTSPFIIDLIYGKQMAATVAVFAVLCLMLPIRYLASGYGLILVSNDYQKIQTLGAILALVVNVVLSFLLIPKLGVIGAAIANVATNIAILTLYLVVVRVKLGTTFLSGLGSSYMTLMATTRRILKTRFGN
ncbi:flippase [Candidatus Chloroploca sp. Khr17]|uniref:flippase n=1 Tax=Candidatus Chloroploca sp. Khr17 TaxID=2496869 RepID=UPI00101C100C|nr:flippase [Candidatus Chloroploca sp. Khr17]